MSSRKPTKIWWEIRNIQYGNYDDFPTVYVRGTESQPYGDDDLYRLQGNAFEWTWKTIPENEKINWIGEDKRAVAEEEKQRREKQKRLRKEEEERRRQERELADAAEEERRRLEAERESAIPRIRDELTAEANAVLRMNNRDEIQEFFGFPRGQLTDDANARLQTAGKKMVRKFHPDKTSDYLGNAIASEFFSQLNIKLAILAFPPNNRGVLIGTGRKSSKKCRKCGLPKS